MLNQGVKVDVLTRPSLKSDEENLNLQITNQARTTALHIGKIKKYFSRGLFLNFFLLACRSGSLELVQFLLKNKANVNLKGGDDENTPL